MTDAALRPRKVALFLPDLSGGGAERSMLNLACGLADDGLDVDLVLVNARGPYLAQVPPSVRVVDLKAPIPRKSIGALARYLQEERPIALLSALDNANVVAVLAKRLARVPTRVVISIRNHLSVDYGNAREWRFRLHKACVHLFYSLADGIVSVSGGVADDLAQMTRLPRERIQVIYNPVVSDELLQKAKQPVEHPWFAPGQPPVILSVGRLAPQKDQATLLRAFALLRQNRTARLMILGEGEERASLEALAQELGVSEDVALPGFVQNPFAYMARAGVFVLSSKYEGLPGVLIQAMASGAPVVSTDCPSGPREILAEGRYGPLVPVGDAAALAQGIEKALSEGRVVPPAESWAPFRSEVAVREYRKALCAV